LSSFHFQILPTKMGIFDLNHFLISCFVIMGNLKMKKKDKILLTLRSGDLNPRFSVIFPPMIWIFTEASKRDRTLKRWLNLRKYTFSIWSHPQKKSFSAQSEELNDNHFVHFWGWKQI
jgi:hypothetical protein